MRNVPTAPNSRRIIPNLWFFACALTVGMTLTACQGEGPAGDGPASRTSVKLDVDPELVLAEDRLGPLTWSEVDAHAVKEGAQGFDADDADNWYRLLVRRLAIERLLLDEAELVGVEQDPAFERIARQIERLAFSDAYLASLGPQEPPTREQLEELFEQTRERYQRPERRRILHIFKRFGDAGPEAAVAALEALKARSLAGEDFAQLASAESDSETRHQGGELGFVARGRFSDDFDQVVFALGPETPSEVVKTKDGAHLFYVTNILEERQLQLEDVEPLLRQELMGRARLKRLREVAIELPLASEARTAPRDVVLEALQNRRRQAPLFQLRDFTLTAGDLIEQTRQLARQLGGRQPQDLMMQLLEEVAGREVIYQHLLEDDTFEAPSEFIDAAHRQKLVEHFAERKLEIWINNQPELVKAHYESQKLRFAVPPRLSVTRLEIPRSGSAAEQMARLEASVPDLDAGRSDLSVLAQEMGGELETLSDLTPRQLGARDPGATRFATLLAVGEHSPPYSSGESLVLFRVDEKLEPSPRPLQLVRDAVIRDLVETQGPRLFQQMSEGLLEEAEFRLNESNLAKLIE